VPKRRSIAPCPACLLVHTHTHTHTQLLISGAFMLCVCVCVCLPRKSFRMRLCRRSKAGPRARGLAQLGSAGKAGAMKADARGISASHAPILRLPRPAIFVGEKSDLAKRTENQIGFPKHPTPPLPLSSSAARPRLPEGKRIKELDVGSQFIFPSR
jgi:hypothetical protein